MLYKQIQENKRQTIKFTLLFILIVLLVGWAVGLLMFGHLYAGAVITGIILLFYIPITYMSASKQVLRLSGAKEVTRNEYPQLFNIVAELSIPARMPMPKIYVIDDPAPNAFATGIKPEDASIGVTQGLLDIMDREELEGVIAHELAHIQNYDTRLMTITIALVGFIVMLSHIGSRVLVFGGSSGSSNDNRKGGNLAFIIIALVLVLLGPLIGQLVSRAISRNREYLADATAVKLTRNPQGLIGALSKIDSYSGSLQNISGATASMYITDPMNNKAGGGKRHTSRLDSHRRQVDNIHKQRARTSSAKENRNLMSTHPPIDDRIKRLSAM